MRGILPLVLLLAVVSCSSGPLSYSSYAIVEIVDHQTTLSSNELALFLKEHRADLSSLYRWENRWVIYAEELVAGELAGKAESRFPDSEVALFVSPFYRFHREARCNQKSEGRGTPVIMTANLVEDSTLQEEYMAYHREQFETWPEVSEGFCRARFQEVVLFREGRQLMLVITLPEGERLDDLNPKTTENNPRVDEWNRLMQQYQEGVEGTPEGVAWVEFQRAIP